MSVINILKPHNVEAFQEIDRMIESGITKIAAPRATGSGKTYLMGALAEKYNDENKIVLEPTKTLCDSIKDKFKEFGIKNTDFMTYQKLIRMSDEDIAGMDYKVIFLDECHHGTAPVWGQKIDCLMAAHSDSIVFGTSATVIRGDNVNVVETLFENNSIEELPLSTAIAKKVLPVPTYVSAIYRLDGELEKLRKKVAASTNTKEEKQEFLEKIQYMKTHFEKSYGVPTILNKHIQEKSGRYLVFCKNKQHLDTMKDVVIGWFKTAGIKNIHSYAVYSNYPDREKDYKEFCEDKSEAAKLMFSINVLNEGIHIKNIDGVLMIRPTMSDIVYRQQLGRVLEAGNLGKHPLVLDLVNNFSSTGDGIGLLKEIKEAVAREKESDPEFDDSDFMDIDTFFVLEQVVEIQEMFKEIEGRLEGSWENGLKHFDKYVREHDGDVFVPANYKDEDGFLLGSWVSCIRQEFKNRNLSDDKINKLSKRGFVWDVLKYNFENNLKALKQYKEREGDCDVPKYHVENVDGINVSLGHWCRNLRSAKKDKQRYSLTKERIEQLENLGFIWDVYKYRFKNNVKVVAKYYKENGKYPPSDSKDSEIRRLGQFLSEEKLKMRNEDYPEWKENIVKRYLPSFSCKPITDIAFDRFVHFAKIYKEKYGHANIKYSDVIDDYNIGVILYNLKQNSKNKLINEEKIERLKGLGISLEKKNVNKEMFDMKMEIVQNAISAGVIIDYNNQFFNEVNIYNWINSTIKRKYKNGKLSSDEAAVIEQLIGKPLIKFFNRSDIFIRIVDVINKKEIAICKSLNEANKIMQKKYGVNPDYACITKRLNGKVTTLYKDRFMFYYATDEEIKQYFSDNKAS